MAEPRPAWQAFPHGFLHPPMLRGLTRGRDVRAAAALGARFATARLSAVATIALAAFVLPLDAFATFGTYAAFLNLAWLAVFGRYEAAAISAGTDREAAAYLRLCAVVGSAVLAVAGIAAAAVAGFGFAPPWLALAFVGALGARAALKLATALATRTGRVAAIGDAAILQAIGQTALLLALAFGSSDGAAALVLSDLAGHAIAAASVVWTERDAFRAAFRGRWRGRELLARARQARDLPLLNLPGSLLALGFGQAPLLALPALPDRDLAGALALGLRLFDAPTQLIAATLTPVLQNRLVRRGVDGLSTARWLALGAGVGSAFALGAAAIALAAPWLAGIGLTPLVAIAPAAAAFQAGLALALPFGDACALYRDQRVLTGLQAGFLAAAAACLLAAPAALGAALAALGALSVVRAVVIGQRLRALATVAATMR